jgi:hypothetical protein
MPNNLTGIEESLDHLATKRALSRGVSFEKAYADMLFDDPSVSALRDEHDRLSRNPDAIAERQSDILRKMGARPPTDKNADVVALENRIEKEAAAEFPKLGKPQAVAKFLGTSRGRELYGETVAAQNAQIGVRVEKIVRKQADATSPNKQEDALDQLDALAADYATTHGCTHDAAYSAVLKTPAGKNLYNRAFGASPQA